MATYDPTNSECLIFTYKEGLLSAVAHDLKLKVSKWNLEHNDGAVTATFDPTSVEVVCAMKDGKDNPNSMSKKDIGKIETSIQKDVLLTKKHTEIRFEADSVTDDVVSGTLTILGNSQPIKAKVDRVDGRIVTEIRINQPDFGIKVFKAMLGTLKIKPEIMVRLSVPE